MTTDAPQNCQEKSTSLDRFVVNTIIAVCGFLLALDMSMLPSTLKALEESFHASPSELGVVLLVQNVGHAVMSPVWGYAADNYNRLRLLYITLACNAVFTFATAFTRSLPSLMFVRLCCGIAGTGLAPITTTMLAASIKPDERGKSFGLMMCAMQIGRIFGVVYSASISHDEVFDHQGWRFAFVSMALVTMTITIVLLCLRGFLTKHLRVALEVAPKGAREFSMRTDFLAIIAKPSFGLLILQGFFASAAISAMDFSLMIFQYMGYSDFQASQIVGFHSVGVAIGALAGGYLSDQCARKSPDHGRLLFGQLGLGCGLLLLLGGMSTCTTSYTDAVFLQFLPPLPTFWASFHVSSLPIGTNANHFYMLLTVAALFGGLQILSFVGAVKPILTEIVPLKLAGQTLAYASAIDSALASIVGAPLVAVLAQRVFGYKDTDLEISDMPRELQHNNLVALSSAFAYMIVGFLILCFIMLSALHCTYAKDKKATQELEMATATMVSQSTPLLRPSSDA